MSLARSAAVFHLDAGNPLQYRCRLLRRQHIFDHEHDLFTRLPPVAQTRKSRVVSGRDNAADILTATRRKRELPLGSYKNARGKRSPRASKGHTDADEPV